MTAPRPLPLLAVLALVPAALLVGSGLLQSATGHEVVAYPEALRHPALVLGGLAAALAGSAASALSLHARPEADGLAVTLRIRRRPLALGVMGAALAMGAVIALYLVAEAAAHAA